MQNPKQTIMTKKRGKVLSHFGSFLESHVRTEVGKKTSSVLTAKK